METTVRTNVAMFFVPMGFAVRKRVVSNVRKIVSHAQEVAVPPMTQADAKRQLFNWLFVLMTRPAAIPNGPNLVLNLPRAAPLSIVLEGPVACPWKNPAVWTLFARIVSAEQTPFVVFLDGMRSV